MNKDEMIKDIKAIIDDRCEAELGQVHASSKGGKVTKTVSTSLIAKDIYNANYRKVGEDEIVVKEIEYEQLKAQNDTLELYNKDLKYRNAQFSNANKLFAKRNDELLDELQGLTAIKQETARVILQELKNKQIFMLADEVFGRNTVITQTINELANKYGIELE